MIGHINMEQVNLDQKTSERPDEKTAKPLNPNVKMITEFFASPSKGKQTKPPTKRTPIKKQTEVSASCRQGAEVIHDDVAEIHANLKVTENGDGSRVNSLKNDHELETKPNSKGKCKAKSTLLKETMMDSGQDLNDSIEEFQLESRKNSKKGKKKRIILDQARKANENALVESESGTSLFTLPEEKNEMDNKDSEGTEQTVCLNTVGRLGKEQKKKNQDQTKEVTKNGDCVNLVDTESQESNNCEVLEMSYEDFLDSQCNDTKGISKNSSSLPEEINSSVVSGDELDGSKSKLSAVSETEKSNICIVKSKPTGNIMNYFKKQNSKSSPRGHSNNKDEPSSPILIVADVHPEPVLEDGKKSSPRRSKNFGIFDKLRKKQDSPKSNVVVKGEEIDMTITQLGTVQLSPSKKKKPVSPRKMAGGKKVTQEVSAKKSTETDSHSLKIDGRVTGDNIKGVNNDLDITQDVDAARHVTDLVTEKQKFKLKQKISSLDNIKLPSGVKTAQAKLSFGKKGTAVETSQAIDNQAKIETKKLKESKKVKNTRQRKEMANKEVLTVVEVEKKTGKKRRVNQSQTMVSTPSKGSPAKKIPLRKSTSKKKRLSLKRGQKGLDVKASNQQEQESNNKNVISPATPARNKSKKVLYRASMAELQDGIRSPLRMKLTRVKSGSNLKQAGGSGKKQSQLEKAQELIHRARGKKTKGKAKLGKDKPASSKKSSRSDANERRSDLRRSTRKSSIDAQMAIQLSYECVTPKKKSGTESDIEIISSPKETKTPLKPRKTPKNRVKKTPMKSPLKPKRKGAINLAPIFGKKKKTDVCKEEDDDVQIVITEVVPGPRRDFLMSGVPEQLKKQTAAIASIQVSDYAPLPTINHVQQVQREDTESTGRCGLNVWDLPDVALPLCDLGVEKLDTCEIVQKMSLGCLTEKQINPVIPKLEKSYICTDIDEETIRYVLAEIKTNNPIYPVHREFRRLVKRRKEAENAEDLDTGLCTNNTQKSLAEEQSSRKRKVDQCHLTDDAVDRTPRKTKKRKTSRTSDVVLITSPGSSDQKAERRRSRTTSETEGPVLESQCSRRRCSPRRTTHTAEMKNPDDLDAKGVGSEHANHAVEDGQKSADLLWIDKYAPSSSGEVLGNSSVVKKIKTWLMEWTHKLDVERKRMRKQQLKEARKTCNSKEDLKKKLADLDDWTEDLSDFDLSGSESDSDDDDDDTLCNTILLTGSTGCGKTAMVYAVAQELGYKVFEVNASSRRNGKQILSQLQETTQSHQVSKKSLDAAFTSFMMTGKSDQSGKKPPVKEEKKLPTSFTNFFKKAVPSQPKDASTNNTTGKRKRKSSGKSGATASAKNKPASKSCVTEDDDKFKNGKTKPGDTEKPPSNTSKSGLKLSSMSLILFEEVDIAFEEDKGFWAAIQTFMTTTKIPIVLTTTDQHFSSKFKFSGSLDPYAMKTTSMVNIASYLQLVCLSENFRVKWNDILSLVKFTNGDLRQAILSLQFWLQSGGDCLPAKQPILYNPKYLLDVKKQSGQLADTPAPSVDSPCEPNTLDVRRRGRTPVDFWFSGGSTPNSKSVDSDDDMEVIRSRIGRKSRRLFIADESSRESLADQGVKPVHSLMATLHEEDSQSSQHSVLDSASSSQVPLSNSTFMTDRVPPMHGCCLESLLAVSSVHSEKDKDVKNWSILEVLDRQNGTRLSLARNIGQVKRDLLYCNLHHILPLPKVKASLTGPKLSSQIEQKRKRIRIAQRTDIYDDDVSDSDTNDTGTFHTTLNKTDTVSKDAGGKNETVDSPCVGESLSALVDMYDHFSMVDAHLHQLSHLNLGHRSRNQYDLSSGTLQCGHSEQLSQVESSDWRSCNYGQDIISMVELMAVDRCRGKLHSVMERLEPDRDQTFIVEKMSIPVESEEAHVKWTQEGVSQLSAGSRRKKAAQGLCSELPLLTQIQRRSVAIDYLPVIRSICKSEQIRQAAKTKRRFLHYLDCMLKQVKQSTIDTMCSSFS